MAMISHRLRRTLLTATSSLNRAISLSPTADFPLVQRSVLERLTEVTTTRAPVRQFSTRQYKLYKEGDEITEDTVLFEGCDFNHWLITMDFPKDNPLSPEEMVSTYEQTCAAGLGIRFVITEVFCVFWNFMFFYYTISLYVFVLSWSLFLWSCCIWNALYGFVSDVDVLLML